MFLLPWTPKWAHLWQRGTIQGSPQTFGGAVAPNCPTWIHHCLDVTYYSRGVKLVSVPGPLQAYSIWSGPDQWNHCITSCYKECQLPTVFITLMQRFQAYLKMMISAFKEQSYQTLQQRDVSWEKYVQFCDVLTRLITNDFETNRNENTMTKNQPKQNTSENPTGFCQHSVSNTSAHLQLSAVILTIRNWHHIVHTSGNLNFSSTLEMHVFRQNIQLVTMYKQYASVQGYLETPRHPWSL